MCSIHEADLSGCHNRRVDGLEDAKVDKPGSGIELGIEVFDAESIAGALFSRYNFHKSITNDGLGDQTNLSRPFSYFQVNYKRTSLAVSVF